MPWQEAIAAGLNIPAALSAEFLLRPFPPMLSAGVPRELASHVLTVILHPFLWYLAGRSVDHRRLPQPKTDSVMTKILLWGMFTCLLISAAMMVASIAFFQNGSLTLKIFALAWTVLGSVAVWRGLRHHARATPRRISRRQVRCQRVVYKSARKS